MITLWILPSLITVSSEISYFPSFLFSGWHISAFLKYSFTCSYSSIVFPETSLLQLIPLPSYHYQIVLISILESLEFSKYTQTSLDPISPPAVYPILCFFHGKDSQELSLLIVSISSPVHTSALQSSFLSTVSAYVRFTDTFYVYT